MLISYSFLVLEMLDLLDFFLDFLYIPSLSQTLVEFIPHIYTSISIQRPSWSSHIHFKSFKVSDMLRLLYRIRFCTQEICVFRDDLLQRLTTNAINSTMTTDVNECVWVYEGLNVVGKDSDSSRNIESIHLSFHASFSCSWTISSSISITWSCILCCNEMWF